MAQIRSAFARTPFKKPTLLIQPPGGRTLINLPTYFEARLSATGHGPGEVHTVTLLGRTVRVRPVAASYRWDFGDGTAPVATTSAGGPYPDGDVRHTYLREGVYQVTVTMGYRGEYAVDGGPWRDVGSSVTISASPVRLEVATAPVELVLE